MDMSSTHGQHEKFQLTFRTKQTSDHVSITSLDDQNYFNAVFNTHLCLSACLSTCLSLLSPPALPPKKRQSLGPAPCRVAIVAPMMREPAADRQVEQVHPHSDVTSDQSHICFICSH